MRFTAKKPPRWLLSTAFFLMLPLLLLPFLTLRQVQNIVRYTSAKGRVLAIEEQVRSRGKPVRIIIPATNVNAIVQYVGVDSNGAMAVPDNSTDVGWFDLGPRPGEVGSSVIAGHFDGIDGKPAVFANLNKLKKGDKLLTLDDKGIITVFVVQGNRVYDPGFADFVFNQNDGAHLNLITCDGVWDGTKKSYSKRLVVFTDLLQ